MLRFDPEPADAYRRLKKDEARAELLRQVREVCAALDADHGQAHLRRHRFADPPLWYVTVRDRDETWVILWEQWPGGAGPASRAATLGGVSPASRAATLGGVSPASRAATLGGAASDAVVRYLGPATFA